MLHELAHSDAFHVALSALAHLLIQVQRAIAREQGLLHPLPAAETVREPATVKGHVRLDQGPHQELPLDQLGVLPVVRRAGILSCSFRRDRSKL